MEMKEYPVNGELSILDLFAMAYLIKFGSDGNAYNAYYYADKLMQERKRIIESRNTNYKVE